MPKSTKTESINMENDFPSRQQTPVAVPTRFQLSTLGRGVANPIAAESRGRKKRKHSILRGKGNLLDTYPATVNPQRHPSQKAPGFQRHALIGAARKLRRCCCLDSLAAAVRGTRTSWRTTPCAIEQRVPATATETARRTRYLRASLWKETTCTLRSSSKGK